MASDDSGIYKIELIKQFSGLDVPVGTILYIGKGNKVDSRAKTELGQTSGHGTFFRSIGLLLGQTVIPHSGKKGTGYNFKFRKHDEIVEWLKEYTKCSITKCDWRTEEKRLIQKYKPPLNILHNKGHIYPGLVELRKQAHRKAAK